MLAFEPIDHRRRCSAARPASRPSAACSPPTSPARAASAPARARDHLLGVRAVNGRGEVVQVRRPRDEERHRARPVTRGLSGSWGTLAVLSEVTFKVLPMPEETAHAGPARPARTRSPSRCCAPHGDALRGVGRRAPAAGAGRAPLARGLRAAGPGDHRAQDRELRQVGRLPHAASSRTLLKAYGAIHELDRENSLAFWGELRAALGAAEQRRAGLAHLDRARPPARRWSPPSRATWTAARSTTGRAGSSGSRCCPPPTPAPPTSAASSPRTAATPR